MLHRGKLAALIWLALASKLASGQEILFSDDFSRADGSQVGNGWVELEQTGAAVGISGNRLQFTQSSDLVRRPMVSHGFAEVFSGTVEWQFQLDWTRNGNESVYAIYMQLGDGAQMSAGSVDAGIGVNLVWSRIDGDDEILGYRLAGSHTPLTPLSGPATVRVIADLGTFTYQVEVDGTLLPQTAAFDSTVALNTLRLFVDQLNETKFLGRTFDSISLQRL